MAKKPKKLDSYAHDGGRKNIPTAELQSLAQRVEEAHPAPPVSYARAHPLAQGERRKRDQDLGPQLVWKGVKITITREQQKHLAETGTLQLGEAQLVWTGKDTQDWSDLVVNVPPIYVQEKIHPRVLIDELKRLSDQDAASGAPMVDLFADFNGIDLEARTEFYAHDMHWTNRMILGDSLQVMASLAEREALRGQVQCIYFDPPYGIKFNSNWQVSTRNRDVKDGKLESLTREPEQVKAFRDTWKNGIHSYLTYLRDRLTVMRDLLTESGSIFVQIGDENVHRVRALMDEVFGEENFIVQIVAQKTGSQTGDFIQDNNDYILWFARNKPLTKFRKLRYFRELVGRGGSGYSHYETSELKPLSLNEAKDRRDFKSGRVWRSYPLTSDGFRETTTVPFKQNGKTFHPGARRHWGLVVSDLERLGRAGRLLAEGNQVHFKRFFQDTSTIPMGSHWSDVGGAVGAVYVVQTNLKVIQRCILMATDPGDLVLDPTCGSGTTATVAEQWGRRWITVDTSRVSLALARARLMGARYPYYLLADSPEGRRKEAEVSGKVPPESKTLGDLRQGFEIGRAHV